MSEIENLINSKPTLVCQINKLCKDTRGLIMLLYLYADYQVVFIEIDNLKHWINSFDSNFANMSYIDIYHMIEKYDIDNEIIVLLNNPDNTLIHKLKWV